MTNDGDRGMGEYRMRGVGPAVDKDVKLARASVEPSKARSDAKQPLPPLKLKKVDDG